MTNEIERLIKISTLRDIQLELIKAQIDKMVIPEIVFEIVKNLEEKYNQKI
jgi:hypothetical protein